MRAFFEPLLGVDLGSVLVHDDQFGQAAARGLGVPAFAHRSHIAFAGAAPQWRSGGGRKMWAHELAHVAQFIGAGEVGAADEVNQYGDSAESEARRAADALIRGERYVPVAGPGAEFQPYFDDAADWLVDTAGDAADYVGDRVDDAIEWTADQLRELIPEDILEFVEDVSSVVQGWIEDGFAVWLEGVLSQVSFVDSIQPFFESIGAYATDFNNFGNTISETAGEALSPIFEPIVNALSTWINPALEAQIATMQSEEEAQEALDKELFQQDAENIQGVVDAIRDGVNDVWNSITEFLRSIPGAEEAWEWLKGAFDFVVNTIDEIIDWVMEQVSDLWDWISEAIEPIKPALVVIAKILFILSPLGPIYILMEYGPQLWDYITSWFSDFDLGSILTQRIDEFTDNVLPFFRDAVRAAASAVASGIEMVIPVIDAMIAGAEELTGFEIEWLAVLRVWLRWVASEAEKFAKLTDEQIKAMMDAALLAFEALGDFLMNLVDFFVRLVMVILNPWLLPVAITGVLWLLIPDAFKPPIIDFILNIIIIAAMAFPDDLFGMGPLAPVIKAAIVAFFIALKGGGNLEEVAEPQRSDAATQRKINATNKIAAIAAGGGVMFVAGYFVGILEGLWTGLSEPFVMIWDLISFVFTAVGKLLQFVHRMGENMFEGGGESAAEDVRNDPDLQADMPAEERAALDEVMRETDPQGGGEQEGSMPSQETLDALGESQTAGENVEAEFEQSRDEASSSDGIDVERIMNWLWSVRTRIREGAASLGRQIAESFFRFIEQSDFQMGRAIGNVAGQLLFEIILGILTAGGWTALSVAKPFIKIGAKIAKALKRTIRPLIRLIRRLRGPVSRGLGAIGDVLRQIPGMRGIIDRIEDAMRRMMRYVDEFDAPRRPGGSTPDAPNRPNRTGDRDGRRRDTDRDGDGPDSRRRRDGDDGPDGRRPRGDGPDGRRPRGDGPDGRRRRRRDDDDNDNRANDRARVRRIAARLRPQLRRLLRGGAPDGEVDRWLRRQRRQYGIGRRPVRIRFLVRGEGRRELEVRINPHADAGDAYRLDDPDQFDLNALLREVSGARMRSFRPGGRRRGTTRQGRREISRPNGWTSGNDVRIQTEQQRLSRIQATHEAFESGADGPGTHTGLRIGRSGERIRERPFQQRNPRHRWTNRAVLTDGEGLDYPDFPDRIRESRHVQRAQNPDMIVGRQLRRILQNRRVSRWVAQDPSLSQVLHSLVALISFREPARAATMGSQSIIASMVIELIARGDMSLDEAFGTDDANRGMLPSSGGGAVPTSRQVERVISSGSNYGSGNAATLRAQFLRKERQIAERFVRLDPKFRDGEIWFTSRRAARDYLTRRLRQLTGF